MDPVTGLYILGGLFNIFGGMQANDAEASAEMQNALAYEQQAELSLHIAEHDQHIFDLESEQFLGSQISAFAKSGVDMSGSALIKLASTKQQISNESNQIIESGKRKAASFQFQADQARQRADAIKSTSLLQTAGSVFSTLGRIVGASN
jgi:hypothetical protein